MKNRISAIILLSLTVCMFSGCGTAIETMNVAQEKKRAQEVYEYTQDTFDLNSAITGRMEDSGVDVIDNEGELVFDVPKGFRYDDTDKMYRSKDARALIQYTTEWNNGTFNLISKDLTEEEMEKILATQFNETEGFEILSWDYITVDGFDAIRFEANVPYEGETLFYVHYIIGAEKNFHSFIYMCGKDSKYKEALLSMEETLRFE